MYDTLIIGAGMSGLTAGIRLAYYGRKVCILERHTTIGGLNSFYRLRGRNYDVGLHAVTNFTPKGTKRGPLARLLRQLRMSWDDLGLVPQTTSAVRFPGATLRFSNDIDLLRSEVARQFPDDRDNFERLIERLADYDQLEAAASAPSARATLAETLRNPLLAEMLLCPLMFYGSAREHDMDWAQFSIMFRSIFLEGFARPIEGVRRILKLLVRRYKELGGELRLRAGAKQIHTADNKVTHVELDDGTQLAANNVVSSAGSHETLRICDPPLAAPAGDRPGRLSFVETVSVLDRQPRELDLPETIVFFNDHERFDWREPAELVDPRSGVICCPNNFAYAEPSGEGVVRTTCLANFDRWNALPPQEYQHQKQQWYDGIAASAVRFVPDFRPHVVETDTFTPTTIRRFTGHDNGAVYGAPRKRYDGRTHLSNLFLCGTDQGFVGIIGAMTSGIAIANLHLLNA